MQGSGASQLAVWNTDKDTVQLLDLSAFSEEQQPASSLLSLPPHLPAETVKEQQRMARWLLECELTLRSHHWDDEHQNVVLFEAASTATDQLLVVSSSGSMTC